MTETLEPVVKELRRIGDVVLYAVWFLALSTLLIVLSLNKVVRAIKEKK